jgi:hypothetical protein
MDIPERHHKKITQHAQQASTKSAAEIPTRIAEGMTVASEFFIAPSKSTKECIAPSKSTKKYVCACE